MRDGFSFPAGAGGVALASVDYLARMMKEAGVKASFVRGGSKKYLVDRLKEGLTGYILDGTASRMHVPPRRFTDSRLSSGEFRHLSRIFVAPRVS